MYSFKRFKSTQNAFLPTELVENKFLRYQGNFRNGFNNQNVVFLGRKDAMSS